MKRYADISQIPKPLAKHPTQAYISAALQVADILEWIIGQIQTKKNQRITVLQTTFSISEEFLRRTYFIKQKSDARFIVIIDRKALQKTISLWRFVAQVYDEVYIADNHSKILLVTTSPASKDKNPDMTGHFTAAMATSQNLTRGNRAESAVISTAPDIFFPLLADFNDIRINNSAPMHEIMPTQQTIQPQEHDGNAAGFINEIERLAGYFVPVSDMATVLQVNPNILRLKIADPDSPEGAAYARGKAKARIALKAQEMELAKVGSPLAMQAVRENLITMESDED